MPRDGDDGPWSSFKATVGTPPQNVRVYPASSQSSLWVVLPEGCTGKEPSDCSSARGSLFDKNASSTWSEKGLYQLTTTGENFLDLSGNGDWGYDTITLGWQGDGSPSINSTLVTGIATPDFYLGELGLNNQPVNFTTFNNPQASLLVTLKDQGKIPSLSWGYTAGGWYQQPFGYGSLTLGGYDTTRFAPNNLTIPFGPDSTRDLLVGVQGISATFQAQLLPEPQFFWIDSTVSQIWLPLDACTAFEQAFGITWDDANSLYFVNDTLHDQLLSQKPNITFTIGSLLSGGITADITFPYDAFNLSVALPLANSSSRSRHFPLQRAANESQYVLGRTFLQQAYITVDYERSSFQVQQAVFPNQSLAPDLVAIVSVSNTNNVTKGISLRLSHGAKIGIIIGGTVAILATLALVLVLCLRQRRKEGPSTELPTNTLLPPLYDKSYISSPNLEPPSEMDSFGKVELPVPVHYPHYELAGYRTQPNELHGDDIRKVELMGSPVKSDHDRSLGPERRPAGSGRSLSSSKSALHQAHQQNISGTISVHELPANVLMPELDSLSIIHSSTTHMAIGRSPSSSALGPSPSSAFPIFDRHQNYHKRQMGGGWI